MNEESSVIFILRTLKNSNKYQSFIKKIELEYI